VEWRIWLRGLVVGGLMLNNGFKVVTVDGEDVHMTPLEYKIHYLLIRNPGRVFSISGMA